MKTVWVNRHNADGSMKPMSEWVQRECMERYTHTYPSLNGGHGFDGGGLPAHHCFISTFGKIAESGFFYEYIGNQRGDGWFYVADGDLPPHSYSENVLAHTSTGEYAIIVAWLYFSRTIEESYGKPICWQPIQQPKFIGECDV